MCCLWLRSLHDWWVTRRHKLLSDMNKPVWGMSRSSTNNTFYKCVTKDCFQHYCLFYKGVKLNQDQVKSLRKFYVDEVTVVRQNLQQAVSNSSYNVIRDYGACGRMDVNERVGFFNERHLCEPLWCCCVDRCKEDREKIRSCKFYTPLIMFGELRRAASARAGRNCCCWT